MNEAPVLPKKSDEHLCEQCGKRAHFLMQSVVDKRDVCLICKNKEPSELYMHIKGLK